jgi:aldehyde:ferredoxin oxidoreductase
MECYERGYLSEQETDGLRLEWGNAEAMVSLVRKIGAREGIGDLLAGGVVRASKEIHPDTEAFAVATKGGEHPGHDPRAFFALGLNYMTGVRGACHERGNLLIPAFGVTLPEMGIDASADPQTMDGIPKLVAAFQDWSSFWNSLVV